MEGKRQKVMNKFSMQSIAFQYDYAIEDDSTRESSCTNETSQDEMSSDETVLRAKKPRKVTSSPFSRHRFHANLHFGLKPYAQDFKLKF
jgi:hypothetical protein